MTKKRRKPSGLDYTALTPVEVYDYIVAGKILTFPNGYVVPETMKPILREVVLNRLKLTREEICKKVNYKYLKQFFLGGARKAFNTSVYDMLNYCFPEMEIKRWELNKVPNGFWEDEENRKEFMLWLAQKERIDVSSIDSMKRIDARLIQKHGGSKALKYGCGVYQLILLIAQVEVKEWQVIKMRVWTEEKVKDAVKWMIEEKLNWSDKEVEEKLSAKVFYDNDLGGLLQKYCNHSPLRALQVAYPNKHYNLKNIKPEYLRKS